MTEVQGEGDRVKGRVRFISDQVQIGCAVITSGERERKNEEEKG